VNEVLSRPRNNLEEAIERFNEIGDALLKTRDGATVADDIGAVQVAAISSVWISEYKRLVEASVRAKEKEETAKKAVHDSCERKN
jgi:hypothetical protein